MTDKSKYATVAVIAFTTVLLLEMAFNVAKTEKKVDLLERHLRHAGSPVQCQLSEYDKQVVTALIEKMIGGEP